jgi:ribosomal protein S18 acetylase RimI-like enzyme
VIVEPARIDDAPAIAAVHVRSWQVAYAPFLDEGFLRSIEVQQRSTSWRRAIQSGASRVLVARDGQHVVGFVSCGRCRDAGAGEAVGEIWALYALDTVWGQGVGRALLDAALQSLRRAGFTQCSLRVLTANARGRRFYRSAGFAEVPERSQWFDLGGQRVEELLCRRSLLD